MTNKEIIRNLRQLVNDGTCDNPDIKDILCAGNCDFLLQKKEPEKTPADALSAIAVKERFRCAGPLFRSYDYPYAVIKGAVLSDRIYDSPFVRKSGDLDILVHRRHVDSVKQILLDDGFIQGRIVDNSRIEPFTRREILFQASQSHQTAPFVKATCNKLCPFVNIDLNTSVFWGEYKHACDMDLVLSETREMSFFNIPFKALLPEMEFISLCLHHYKDMNSIYLLAMGNLRLSLFCDILYYVKNVALDTEKLYSFSKKLHADPFIYYCLWFTNEIFDADYLYPMISRFESDEGKSLISAFGLCDEERREWDIDFFDRLFSSSFTDRFYASLNQKDKDKIKTNLQYM